MAPSATTEIAIPDSKVGVVQQPEAHVHGAEDKTPLEAISHGPLIHPGESLRVILPGFVFCRCELSNVWIWRLFGRKP